MASTEECESTVLKCVCVCVCVCNLCSRRFEGVRSFCQAGRVLLKLSDGCDSHVYF